MKPASALPQYLQEVLATGAERVSGLLCPKCEGGRSHERSLGMYRFDTYVAVKCRRLKCGYSERFALVGVDVTTWNAPARVTRSREFYGALRAPSSASRRYIESRYGIRPHTLQLFGVKEVVGLKALYMPVWSPLAEKRGATVRRFDGWGRKADSFKHDESQPWQSWYLADYPRALVIVEDQLSAMRCWQLGYDAVALLGVALTQDRAAEIERNRRSRVLLALDADAFGTAMQQLRRYPWISRAVLLRDDLKDVSDEEIEKRLTKGQTE